MNPQPVNDLIAVMKYIEAIFLLLAVGGFVALILIADRAVREWRRKP
jgi:hypothetical protein